MNKFFNFLAPFVAFLFLSSAGYFQPKPIKPHAPESSGIKKVRPDQKISADLAKIAPKKKIKKIAKKKIEQEIASFEQQDSASLILEGAKIEMPLAKEVKIETPKAELTNRKTEGDYLGLSLTQTRVSSYIKYSDSVAIDGAISKPSFSGTQNNTGFGVDYKHAFSFGDAFIAPGVFFDYLNAKAYGKDRPLLNYAQDAYVNDYASMMRVKVKNRYGVKVDFGYDVNKTFSPYFTLGRSYISYNTQIQVLDFDQNPISNVRTARANDWVYGFGLKANYDENYSFNLEYNRQKFLAQTTLDSYLGSLGSSTYKYKTTLQTLKFGIIRRF